jgi:hypothetical protein
LTRTTCFFVLLDGFASFDGFMGGTSCSERTPRKKPRK